jgi:zinc/manganese transport system permease protein
MNHIFDPAMFSQPFMQNAFASASVVAILAGAIGVFVVIRAATFAAHAYAQIGFAGAAGAVLIGADPLLGLVVFALLGAAANGALASRRGSDAATALLMVAALGTGALFLALNNAYATAAFGLLFGSIVGIARGAVVQTALLAFACLAALGVIYRPLLYASINPDAALARGLPVRALGVAFAALLAVAAAVTIPTVGTLLIFSLLVGPAASAVLLVKRPLAAIATSVALALATTWCSIVAAYDTGWPVGFFITALAAVVYAAARAVERRRRGG